VRSLTNLILRTLAITWPQDVGLANERFKVAAQVNRDVRHPQGAANSERFKSWDQGSAGTTSLSNSGSFVKPSSITNAPASFRASRMSSRVI
jgi:hypothetical protein